MAKRNHNETDWVGLVERGLVAIDIGQISASQKSKLNRMAVRGEIVKGKALGFPIPKTCWAYHDVFASRGDLVANVKTKTAIADPVQLAMF
jgi:hypothetical protein